MLSIQQDPTPDLNPDTLGALSGLMLAQAQEIFVHKAIHGRYYIYQMNYKLGAKITDNMKDSSVAKLASQCEDLYGESLKIFQRENLKQIWDKDWIAMVSILFKYLYYMVTKSFIDCRKTSSSACCGRILSKFSLQK